MIAGTAIDTAVSTSATAPRTSTTKARLADTGNSGAGCRVVVLDRYGNDDPYPNGYPVDCLNIPSQYSTGNHPDGGCFYEVFRGEQLIDDFYANCP